MQTDLFERIDTFEIIPVNGGFAAVDCDRFNPWKTLGPFPTRHEAEANAYASSDFKRGLTFNFEARLETYLRN